MPNFAGKYLRFLLATAFALIALQPSPVHALQVRVLRVAENGLREPSCGLDWQHPCALVYALDALTDTSTGYSYELWVKAGMYYPETTSPYPQVAHFRLKNGVALYGGFAGNEIARTARDPEANRTILSGDIDHNDAANPAETASDLRGLNANHVVMGYGVYLNSTAVLDGFTITAGSAVVIDPNLNVPFGGGLYFIDYSTPTLANLRITGNYADESGGGIYNDNASPRLSNVILSGNEAVQGGGVANVNHSNPVLENVVFQANVGVKGPGMYNANNSPKLTNVTFQDHATGFYGGAMHNNASDPFLNEVRFLHNTAQYGGALYNTNTSYVTVTNTTFEGNSAAEGGAIYNDDGTTLEIGGTKFTNNHGEYGASCITHTGKGTLFMINSTLAGNTGESTIENQQQYTVSILKNVILQNNTGPIVNDAESTVHLEGVMFRNNIGGALSNKGYATAVNSAFIGNTGITDACSGTITHNNSRMDTLSISLRNVTISGNQAACGGGIAVLGGRAELTYVTVQKNIASLLGNAIYAEGGSVIDLRNSIVWDNGPNAFRLVGADTKVNANYSDIQMDPFTVYPGEGNINANPHLGEPGNYGGSTWVTPLLPGSAVIDLARCSVDARTDQRGVDRGFDTACDMGAYEAREFTFRAVSGGGQSTEVGQLFGSPLIVEVASPYGDPVDGAFVSFYAPQSGASAMITQLPPTVTGGTAQVSARANNRMGEYEVTARIKGLTPVTFHLKNEGKKLFLPVLLR